MHDHDEYKSKWASKIKSILDKCSMSYLWDDYTNAGSAWIKLSVAERLRDMDKQNWQNEVDHNALCTNYRIFKRSFGMEKYLLDLNNSERISLSKFRCGSHKLPVSTGRYLPNNTPKLCTLCTSEDRGDEYHYALICPSLSAERTKYVKSCYTTRLNTMKMYQLLNTTNVKELFNLAKFTQVIMSKFQ